MKLIFTIQMLVIPVLSLIFLVLSSGCSKEPIKYDNDLMMWVKNKKSKIINDNDWPDNSIFNEKSENKAIRIERKCLRETMETWEK